MKQLLEQRLSRLKAADRLRDPSDPLLARAVRGAAFQRVPLLRAASNDYLGLANEALDVSAHAAGPGASRLVYGTHPEHQALEQQLADWLRTEASLTFCSAYAANLGTVACLAQPNDRVFSDALNHASIVDGCRLSRAKVHVYPHCDLTALEQALREPHPEGHTWIISESYFSMDGTTPDLRGLARLADSNGASLIVDEAHALGVFGPEGRGLCAESGVTPAVLVGAFGKAFGLQGGFIAGSAALRLWAWNSARSFVYSTATSPALAAAASDRLARVRVADGRRRHLAELCKRFASSIDPKRLPAGRHGPLFPLLVGEDTAALSLAECLADQGILVQAIRPPTVPAGAARIRLTLNASFGNGELDRLLAALTAGGL